ncbi:MAG: fumarate hydratase, partial [Alphaproteobacteria bacterium]|nr:fumarate hydratase [Alphaproteobacteria bacterium]
MSEQGPEYHPMFPLGADDTPYRKLTDQHVSVAEFDGQEILKIEPAALTELAAAAFQDVSHFLRPGH